VDSMLASLLNALFIRSEFQRVVIFISTVSDERTGELQISIRDSAAADDVGR